MALEVCERLAKTALASADPSATIEFVVNVCERFERALIRIELCIIIEEGQVLIFEESPAERGNFLTSLIRVDIVSLAYFHRISAG